MLEWLVTIGATVGATELGKAIFEQVLKLGQAAAEDYVKDFFKGCLKEGLVTAKPEVAKKAVASALQAFLLLVTDELEDQELSKADIRDRYDVALIQFVKDESVKPILGSAFEKDCSAIDSATLAALWEQSMLRGKPFPAMPEGFDWQRIGSEYLKKVRRIVRETPDLRSLLETALLEDIARHTAHLNTQISPGFDVARYRKSLQSSYGYLKLSTIDTTDQQYRVKLWKMFIEQTVREDIRQTSEVLKTSEVSEEALERDRRDYFQQPSRKVLEAIASQIPDFSKKSGISARAVILGDPGAGKSTLLQYLALEWVESQTSEVFETSEVSGEVSARLPLLIELREYAIAQTNSFLDFLHRGRGVDWQFDQQQLHQYLQEHPSLVMFDGLDEVFDRPTQAAIIDDIIRFAQQYSHAQILITSRIIGYNPERLQHAGFRHFTIQPLDTDEIHEFIDRWYILALGKDPDKERLKQRLKDAIANSTAIQNLADNPLLLTMMAILNRRQELPRDRADLYDQASRVLLYHWDVDHKKLNLPLDTIGRREKQEMLRLIAYDMQAGEEGLKGNLISADRLTRILTDYLRDQGFGEPREKANKLIDQLRHRNFILCDRGADNYGFIHRTFLEYFCAVEIVNRFEKQRTLTFEQLRDEVFGNHWQDKTWHEVLRLVCGMIDPKFTGEISDYLTNHIQEEKHLNNLFFAISCLLEIRNRNDIHQLILDLLDNLKELVKKHENSKISEELTIIIMYFGKDLQDLPEWLMQCTEMSHLSPVPELAVRSLILGWHDSQTIFSWIKSCAQNSSNPRVRQAAIRGLSGAWKDKPGVLDLLKECAQNDENTGARLEAFSQIVKAFGKELSVIDWLGERAENEQSYSVRFSILKHIENLKSTSKDIYENLQYPPDPKIFIAALELLAVDSSEWSHTMTAIQTISSNWKNSTKLLDFLASCAISNFGKDFNWIKDIRLNALKALAFNYPTHSKTLELLRDRAENDPDEQLQQWAQEQLKMQNVELQLEDNSDG